MPESQLPPIWGPAPDERDLDAVLSGEQDAVPEGLRQVAAALAALRAAPSRGELSGEDSARAAFRAAFHGPVPARGYRPPEARPAVPGHTLVLPAVPRTVRRGPRHRRPRATDGVRRSAVLFAGAAAVVVAGTAVALSGALPGGPVNQIGSAGRNAPGGAAAANGSGGTMAGSHPGVNGSGVPDATATRPAPAVEPSPSVPPEQATLCRDYYGFYTRPDQSADWSAEMTLGRKLSKMAGGPQEVFNYCRPYLDFPPWSDDRAGSSALPSGSAGGDQGAGSTRPTGHGPWWGWGNRPPSPAQ